jgi:alkylation response protein AidB-like acyl-CoA dehydrogenase
MTDGAARLLAVQNENLPPSHPFHEVFSRLTARVDSWTSGQWMTERAGGSDVQNSETWATYSPLAQKTGEYGRIDEGDYLVSGFKFFSSATDANIAVLLAKTESGKLSVFLAPLTKLTIDAQGKERRATNGIRIHRLKKKLGTKQLPTAELELKDVRAHLVGPLDRGIATISTLLNITRLHTFNGTVAGLGRCLAVAKAFAKARTTRGQGLMRVPLHLRTLADVELKRRGILHLSQFTAALVGFVESGFPAQKPAGLSCLPAAGIEADIVLRALTATAKAFCSKVVIQGAQECMEAMGGVGYIDDPDDSEHNVARMYRDLTVNAIWEGTTNVMSSELLRFISVRENLGVLSKWVGRNVERIVDETHRNALRRSWESLHARLEVGTFDLEEVLGDGRRGLFSLGWVVCGLLLVADAERDGDALAAEAARRWVLGGEGGVGEWVFHDVLRVGNDDFRPSDVRTRAKLDYKFLYGEDGGREEVSKL